MADSLTKLDQATRMLAEVRNIDDAKDLINLAEAARVYAKQVELGLEAQNHAAEIKLRAQRKAGEILDKIEFSKGAATPLHDVTALENPTHDEIGITRRDAHIWKTIAAMPEEKFEAVIAETKDAEKELSTAGIYWTAKKDKAQNDKQIAPELPTDKYRIVYADPPWKYQDHGVTESEYYGGTKRHYPSMTIQELCEMDIKNITADNAVLFIWVTSPKLDQVWEIIKAWGFEYKTSFVWDKVKHNFGYYNSVRHELLLVCGRGSSTPDIAKLFDSVQVIERSDEHSEKPQEFRQIIDTLYPTGKRIELFARKKVDGWDTWGNEYAISN